MSQQTFIITIKKGLVEGLGEPQQVASRLHNLLEGMYPGCEPSIQHIPGRVDPSKKRKVKE